MKQQEQQLLGEFTSASARMPKKQLHELERGEHAVERVEAAKRASCRRRWWDCASGARSSTKQARSACAMLCWRAARGAAFDAEQILNDRSYTADAVQKFFASSERGGERRTSAPSACWPITPKSAAVRKRDRAIFCAMNWNTSSSKRLTMRARASPCCAMKSAAARRSSWIRCAN